jgi:hypothetical protein
MGGRTSGLRVFRTQTYFIFSDEDKEKESIVCAAEIQDRDGQIAATDIRANLENWFLSPSRLDVSVKRAF